MNINNNNIFWWVVPGFRTTFSCWVQNVTVSGSSNHKVGLADGREVIQQEVQTVVIRYNLRSHTVLRYLCAESVGNRQTLHLTLKDLIKNVH